MSGEIPGDTVQFWVRVADYQVVGSHPFRGLSKYALECMSTPVSNAVVERVFSQVTLVKTNVRNRMGVDMLNAVIRIRAYLHFRGKCCRDFVPTAEMLRLFNTANMYEKTSSAPVVDEAAHRWVL